VAIATAIDVLCEAVESSGPILAVCDAFELLMDSIRKPTFWDRREDLFLLLDRYASGRLLEQERIGFWCLLCCQLVLQNTADYTECQLWLQRAARCGIGQSEAYEREHAKVNPILSSVGAKTLPPAAEQEDPSKVLGQDEQGHFDVERTVNWTRRIQRLYPWVVGVRRVRGEGAIAHYPTRLLEMHELARHGKGLPAAMMGRVIPAVLDASYSAGSKDRAIRINIILPEGTTGAQREAAIRRLRENKRIFPDE
jgi:hypothetical protein